MQGERELRIRYILDKSSAEATAREFHAAESQRINATVAAAKGAATATRENTEAMKEGTSAAAGLGTAMIGIAGAQMGLSAITQVVGAISEQMKSAAEYTLRVAEAFSKTRDSMREIAAIQGKGLTNDFAGQQLDVIKQAKIVTVEEGIEGIKAFQQQGSGYVGDGPNSRVSQASLNNMLPLVMATAKRMNMGQGVAMKLFAGAIQTMPKGSSEKDYMDTFAKMMAQSLDSKGSAETTAKNLAPILAQFGGEGGEFGDSPEAISDMTKMVNVISESRPGQSGMITKNLMTEFLKDSLKGKDDDLGIKEGMGPMQKVYAIYEKFRSETGDKGDFKEWYARKVSGKAQSAGNMRAMEGLDVLIRKGIKEKMFDRMDEKAAGASGEGLKSDLGSYMQDEGGGRNRTDAETSIGVAESGMEDAPLADARAQARNELTAERRFKQWTWGDILLKRGTGKQLEERLVSERALEDTRQKAVDAGIGHTTALGGFVGPGDYGSRASSATMADPTIQNEIRDLLKQIAAQGARRTPAIPPPIQGRPNAPNVMRQ